MNRVITVQVQDEYIKKSSSIAGAAGSHNAVTLEISFNSLWEGTTKKVYFFDAYGQNPVCIILTLDKLKEGATDVYLVPIPSEPLAYEGDMTMTIKGVELDGENVERIVMSASTTFKVLPAEVPDAEHEPADLTPSQAEQIQAQIDAMKIDILTAEKAVLEADGFAEQAGQSAEAAAAAATVANNKAGEAAASAEQAAAAKEAIESMTVDATGLAEGAAPTVDKTIDGGVVKLTFGIPKGDTGAVPNIKIGTTQTLPPGSSAEVTITGTPAEPVLNFGIPRGFDGEGSGDMRMAVYDTDADGKVNAADTADSVPWSGVQNKPSSFNPSSHTHTKSDISDFSHTHTKSEVGLGNVDNVKQMPISGGTFTGKAYAQSNTDYTTAQIRNIVLSTSDPSGGNNGDIWIKYS